MRSYQSWTYPPAVWYGSVAQVGLYDYDTGDLVARTGQDGRMITTYFTTNGSVLFYMPFVNLSGQLTPFTATKNGLYITLFTFRLYNTNNVYSTGNAQFLFSQACNSDIFNPTNTEFWNPDYRPRMKGWYSDNVTHPYTLPSNILGAPYNATPIHSATSAPWIALA